MCYTIKSKLNKSFFTGYKLVTKDKHGHLYSPFTGYRYKPGKIATIKKIGKHCTWEGNIFDVDFFDPGAAGRTAVFVLINDAQKELQGSVYDCSYQWTDANFYIAEMTLSNDLKYGDYGNYKIVSGTYIEKIKLIK